MFNFKSIQAALNTSFPFEVQDPITKEPSGWVLELATPAHAAAQARVTAILDRIRKRRESTGSQDEKDAVDLIAARILGWSGLEDGDAEVPYSAEVATACLSGAKAFWLRNQVIEALGDKESPFVPKTPSSS